MVFHNFHNFSAEVIGFVFFFFSGMNIESNLAHLNSDYKKKNMNPTLKQCFLSVQIKVRTLYKL